MLGVTCYARKSQDGVEDVFFMKKGQYVSGKNIIKAETYEKVLKVYANLTHNKLASETRAERAAEMEEERRQQSEKRPITQHKHKLHL